MHCLQYDCYQGVTVEAGMCLTAYYLSLLQVYQVHAKQDAPNEGHHQLHRHHGSHLEKQSLAATIISSTIATKV
jgi:hypothetical protein